MNNHISNLLVSLACIQSFSFFSFYEQFKSEEYKIKAVFVYNFTQYVEWVNQSDTSEFVICVVGKSDILKPLYEISKSKQVGNKKIKVKAVQNNKEITDCNILFIASDTKISDTIPLPASVKDNILIITESGEVTLDDADMNFVIVEDRIKFEVHQKALEKKGLKFSSHLLKLAIIVE